MNHLEEAKALVARAQQDVRGDSMDVVLATAQVHATLAVVMALDAIWDELSAIKMDRRTG